MGSSDGTISHVEPFDQRRLKVIGLFQYIAANTQQLVLCPRNQNEQLKGLLKKAAQTKDANSMLPYGYDKAKLFTDE